MPIDETLGNGHAEDIFGTISYEAPRPAKRRFFAWHHPRKQLVRTHQWVSQIRELIDMAPPEGDVLRYLGLPGDDLLDLRLFYREICEPRNLVLKFLGFNRSAGGPSSSQTELNISMDEITKLGLVDTASEIVGDDFCRIANINSIAWRKARTLGPYDVVNLDLCDGFGRHAPGSLGDTHYNAVAQLLSLQARNKNPWLLLLTTRAGEEHIDSGVLEALIETVQRNLRECVKFKDGSAESFAIDCEETLREAVGTPSGLVSVFLLGLCKWLLRLALDQHPPTKVAVKSVMSYRVLETAPHEDLISIALRFEPMFVPAQDPSGLVGGTMVTPSECDLAARAIKPIAKRRNADEMLASDSALHEAMIEATSQLLELARYDTAEYRKWLHDPQQSPD